MCMPGRRRCETAISSGSRYTNSHGVWGYSSRNSANSPMFHASSLITSRCSTPRRCWPYADSRPAMAARRADAGKSLRSKASSGGGSLTTMWLSSLASIWLIRGRAAARGVKDERTGRETGAACLPIDEGTQGCLSAKRLIETATAAALPRPHERTVDAAAHRRTSTSPLATQPSAARRESATSLQGSGAPLFVPLAPSLTHRCLQFFPGKQQAALSSQFQGPNDKGFVISQTLQRHR